MPGPFSFALLDGIGATACYGLNHFKEVKFVTGNHGDALSEDMQPSTSPSWFDGFVLQGRATPVRQ
jgi:hypothetical protein